MRVSADILVPCLCCCSNCVVAILLVLLVVRLGSTYHAAYVNVLSLATVLFRFLFEREPFNLFTDADNDDNQVGFFSNSLIRYFS